MEDSTPASCREVLTIKKNLLIISRKKAKKFCSGDLFLVQCVLCQCEKKYHEVVQRNENIFDLWVIEKEKSHPA